MTSKKLLFPAPSFLGDKETTKKDYTFETKIGDGAFGQVWKVLHKKSDKYFACKQVSKDRVIRMIEQFRREVLIMYKISHPNIIKLYHHFEETKSFYLIMELAEGGNLFQKLAKEEKFSEPQAFLYFSQILDAVEYLHTRNPVIIHRDIKPENIILDAQGKLKLTDFGWSNYYSAEQNMPRYTMCGTYEYLAPEIVNEKGHTPSVDIWCLGILLYEMVSGNTPFKAPTKEALLENIAKGKIKFPSHVTAPLRNLILLILEKNWLKRIGVKEIKSHEWFLKYQKKTPETSEEGVKKVQTVQKKPSASILDSCRKTIVTIKEEINARVEIVKILKTQIRVATETIFVEEAAEGKLEQEVLERKKKLFEFEENIRNLYEKHADADSVQEKLIVMQQRDKIMENIENKKKEIAEKNLEIEKNTKILAETLDFLSKAKEKYEDKARYLQNFVNYLKKLKNKGSMLHNTSQSQISELQISYDCLKAKITETEQKLEKIENPESKLARELMAFIKQNKAKILDFSNVEEKLNIVEDNVSLSEFNLERIKIEYLDTKKKFIKESFAHKEKALKIKSDLQNGIKVVSLKERLETEIEVLRETAKKYQLGKLDIIHAKEKIKALKLKINTVTSRISTNKSNREKVKQVISDRSAHIESVEMELGLLKSSILAMDII